MTTIPENPTDIEHELVEQLGQLARRFVADLQAQGRLVETGGAQVLKRLQEQDQTQHSLREADKDADVAQRSLRGADKVADEAQHSLRVADKDADVAQRSLRVADKVADEVQRSLRGAVKDADEAQRGLRGADKDADVAQRSLRVADKVADVAQHSLRGADKDADEAQHSLREADEGACDIIEFAPSPKPPTPTPQAHTPRTHTPHPPLTVPQPAGAPTVEHTPTINPATSTQDPSTADQAQARAATTAARLQAENIHRLEVMQITSDHERVIIRIRALSLSDWEYWLAAIGAPLDAPTHRAPGAQIAAGQIDGIDVHLTAHEVPRLLDEAAQNAEDPFHLAGRIYDLARGQIDRHGQTWLHHGQRQNDDVPLLTLYGTSGPLYPLTSIIMANGPLTSGPARTPTPRPTTTQPQDTQ
ncbi:BN159_2729 family protein [Streptomyces sp. NPDC001634]|uniref:BN159_2729 family protein n=1 Tax=Streptomyces sp. NPDC001634 TaxID=3154390 RepID=UPI00333383CE